MMERADELLQAVVNSAAQHGTSNAPVCRWALEMTRVTYALEARVAELESRLDDVMEANRLRSGR